MNTIWSLEKSMGRRLESFEDLVGLGVEHFQHLFQAPEGAQLMDIMRLTQVFPRFVGEEENLSLMEEVSEEELKLALQSFQKDKSPRPDGWTIEFFTELYELLGDEILKVVETLQDRYIHINNSKDKLIWGMTPIGSFSIQEAYKIKGGFNQDTSDQVWKNVWEAKLWKKNSTFTWKKLSLRALPTLLMQT